MSGILQGGARRGVVAVIERDGCLLVIRRSQHVVAPGALCFPGGAIQPGESEPVALIRELDEELGVAIQPLRQIWQSVTDWNVQISWWHAHLPPAEELHPCQAEVAAVYWMTIDDLHDHADLLSSNLDFLQGVRSGQIVLT
ncbi:MAG: NUDIX domain-containing protein [Planctomycetales bacterium]|nr:NUDIX domain-containing protein [Planctomycetales bacterium]NIM08049.1 NUDIX domain-containing protein [Planctomycetales bacterium]NIN07540.1 NUDIX domain-containing protein [Planctomycetales bacterium]NIN76647.1 NUDIX domain-containing protein [Planctomycetales bacterium]NIO33835.1 NUDIX domain-containing protein [Planctomycetales bacterium]